MKRLSMMIAALVFASMFGLAFALQSTSETSDCNPVDAAALRAAAQHIEAGNQALEASDYHTAYARYSCAVDAEPGYYAGYYNRGIVSWALGDHDMAMGDFYRAMDLEPELPDSYRSLGKLYDAMGDYPDALDYYQQYIDLAHNVKDEIYERVQQLESPTG